MDDIDLCSLVKEFYKMPLNKKYSFLYIIYLLCFLHTFIFISIVNAAQISNADELIEKQIMRQAEEQKNEQLKDYFKDYYLNQGKEFFKDGKYKEAYAKFKRALYWKPEYEPAKKYLQLAEEKIVLDYLKNHINQVIVSSGAATSAAASSLKSNSKAQGAYRVGLDDTLEIFVGGSPELSKDLVVRSDGTIYYPSAGSIQALGLTLSELEQEIAKGLSGNIKDPQVAVTVKSFGKIK